MYETESLYLRVQCRGVAAMCIQHTIHPALHATFMSCRHARSTFTRHCTRKYKLSVSYMRGYHDRGLDRIKNTICTQYRIKQAYQNAGCKHLARSPGRLPSRKAAHERRYARWLSPPAISMLALSNGTRISLSGRAAPITLSESRVAAPSLLVSAWRPPAHARRLQMETAPPPVDSGAQRGWRRGVRSAR